MKNMRGPSALFAGWLGLAWELASIVIQLMCLLVARPGEIGLRHSSIGCAQRTVDIAFFLFGVTTSEFGESSCFSINRQAVAVNAMRPSHIYCSCEMCDSPISGIKARQ